VGVISARDVDEAEKDRITGLLSERLGTDTAVRLRVDPAIIGGLIVRQGDRVTDGSVRRRLAELRQELVAS
jgi:ATP synthase F1 delta subunit